MPFLAALIPAVIGAGASLIGSSMQASAANKATKAQQESAKENKVLAQATEKASLADLDKSLADALGQFDESVATSTAALDPYRQAGEQSLSQIMALLGLSGTEASKTALSNFTTSPGYEFRVGEGVKALDRSANARGSLYSGAQGKALIDYGQEMGSQEFGNYFDRLTGVASTGYRAAADKSTTISNILGSKANAMLGTGSAKASTRLGALSAITGATSDYGNATAAGAIGVGNAWNSGLSNISSIAGDLSGTLSNLYKPKVAA